MKVVFYYFSLVHKFSNGWERGPGLPLTLSQCPSDVCTGLGIFFWRGEKRNVEVRKTSYKLFDKFSFFEKRVKGRFAPNWYFLLTWQQNISRPYRPWMVQTGINQPGSSARAGNNMPHTGTLIRFWAFAKSRTVQIPMELPILRFIDIKKEC